MRRKAGSQESSAKESNAGRVNGLQTHVPLNSSQPKINASDKNRNDSGNISKAGTALSSEILRTPSQPTINASDKNRNDYGNNSSVDTALSSEIPRTSFLPSSSQPLIDLSVIGAPNYIIPVSTVDLFFKRFDMLQHQYDDLKSSGNRSLASRSVTTAILEDSNNDNRELAMRVTVVEDLVTKQNLLLENINADNRLLLEKNTILENKLDNALSCISDLQCAHKDTDSADDLKKRCTRSVKINAPERIECCLPVDGMNNNNNNENTFLNNNHADIVISNICDGTNEQRAEVVHSVLSTVLPSFNKNDGVSIGSLQSKKQGQSEPNTSKSVNSRQPWVVRLSSRDSVNSIMCAKNKFTAFDTKKVDVSSLNQETCDSLIQSRIFIKVVLHLKIFKNSKFF